MTRPLFRALAIVLLGAVAVSAQSSPAASATVNQLMRGVFFINSNVVFLVQSDDPAAIKRDFQPSRAVNPLGGTFGGWEAVENAALAIADSAALLELPRSCSNGKAAPVKDAEWLRFVDDMRNVSLKAYKAAQKKSQDAIVDVSEELSTACSACHRVYRDTGRPNSRCVK